MAAHEDESDFPIEHHLSTTKDADNTTEKEQAQLAGLADQQRARPRKEGLAQEAAGNILGIPRFREDFGAPFNGDSAIPANWQSAFTGAPIAS
ncbi:hypothetical protein MCOR31_005198 [Pyricularia oryzae]|nr:hypothetical protein MCOR19_001451 [Pyricularia oryzae]KAI6369317.1 hypothetical protein MCOR31_005198 [Pyricularia oryzae]KAI6461750.1 hypothetical protein MCOR15_004896 [Pyricularia oryzae]KAI6515914.1 hypothetical protein MCOR10_007949 [Pyricularia oryzae]KAI6537781.1 hypothetical protein MCOR16_001972 [Pyricularia oryzae]